MGTYTSSLYISSAWQGEGKISKNVTHRQTHIHFIIIYIISLAGGRQNKQKRDTQTHIHFIIIYISSAWQGEGKISKNMTHRHTDTHTLHHYHQLGRGKAK